MPIVSTGQFTIADLTDGVNARLSSESHTLTADADGVVPSYAGCSTAMSVSLGASDDTANWTFAASPTAGLVGSLVGNAYAVTALTVDAGFVDITASRVGFSSLTSRFSISKAKAGAVGASMSLVAGQGFTFQDGVATPATQSIAITLIRGTGLTAPVTFRASNGAALKTDNGALTLFNYMAGTPGVGDGDTAYVDLADFGGERQLTITAFCGDVTASHTLVRLDFSTAAAGATVGATIGVNVGGQITAANASTLIADAAIGSAQIGSIALVGTSNFSVKTSLNGQRMEMDSRAIKIYDASGVLRVQIGDLTA